MWDDDAAYSINLKTGTSTLFFKIPEQYTKRQPDYGSGDGYYAYPAPVIDAKKKTVSIRFDRHRTNTDYRSYLLATTDLHGRLIRIEEKSDPE
jgi:hypothetical protein